MSLSEAVEALARAMGLWRDHGPISGRIRLRYHARLLRDGSGFVVRRWAKGQSGAGDAVRLGDREAMLWLRCYMLGTTRVRCPDCDGDGTRWECIALYTADNPDEVSRFARDLRGVTRCRRLADGRWEVDRALPCPTCTGPAVECELCGGEGREQRRVASDRAVIRSLRADGWTVTSKGYGGAARYTASRSCDPCSGEGTIPGKPTGHVDRSWAEVLLGAMPRHGEPSGDRYQTKGEAESNGGFGGKAGRAVNTFTGWRWSDETPGDPEARAMLTELSDQLQLAGIAGLDLDNPAHSPDLGVWLALWIGQQPCEVCKGTGGDISNSGIMGLAPCPHCAGSGLALGAHDQEMAEAGDRLAEQLGAAAVGQA